MEWKIVNKPENEEFAILVKGDCDLYDAPAFLRAMLELFEQGCRKMFFDFSGVAYLDSSGVGALIRIIQNAKRIGASVRFFGIQGSPREVLRMSNILPLLKETTEGKTLL